MIAVDGQQDLLGGEQVGDRVERAAKALWMRDLRRSHGTLGESELRNRARELWPRVQGEYVAAARVALEAADR